MFSGNIIATVINIGIIVYFLLAAVIEMLVGRKRGWKRQLVHIGFTALGLILSYFITEIVIGAFTFEDGTKETLLSIIGDGSSANDTSYRVIESLDSDLLNIILKLPLATVIAPLLFTLVFIVLNLILKIICFIVNKFVPKSESKAQKLIGMAIGFVEGALVAAFIMLPLTAYTGIIDESVEVLDAADGTLSTDVHEIYDEYISPVSKNPVLAIGRIFGGGAMINGFATVDIGDDEINMRDEVIGMVKIATNLETITEINWEKLNANDKKAVGDFIDSVSNSKFYTKSFAGLFRTLASVSSEENGGTSSDGSSSDLVGALFGDFLNVLGSSTEHTVKEDLTTFKKVFFILSDGDIFLTYNATVEDKLSEDHMIDAFNSSHSGEITVLEALVDTLRENKRTAALVETITELALTVIMESIGLDEDSAILYDNVIDGLEDINTIDRADYATEDAYKDAVTEEISSTLKENDITIDDAILEDLSEHAIELRDENGTLSEEDLQDVLMKYFESYESNKTTP